MSSFCDVPVGSHPLLFDPSPSLSLYILRFAAVNQCQSNHGCGPSLLLYILVTHHSSHSSPSPARVCHTPLHLFPNRCFYILFIVGRPYRKDCTICSCPFILPSSHSSLLHVRVLFWWLYVHAPLSSLSLSPSSSHKLASIISQSGLNKPRSSPKIIAHCYVSLTPSYNY